MANSELTEISLNGLTDGQKLALIREKFAQNATAAEFALLLHMAQKYDLDILTGQIFLVKYKNKKTDRWYPAQIFASRDGFLHKAHASKNFDGMHTTFREEKGDLIACTTVYSKIMTRPIVVEVYLSEYTSKRDIWIEKKRTMLQKVGESQALRRAFDISGIYEQAEFDKNNNGPAPKEKEINPAPTSKTKMPPESPPPKSKGWKTNADVPEVFITPFRLLGCKTLRAVNEMAAETNWEFVTVQKIILRKLYKFTDEDQAPFFNFCVGANWDDDKITDYLAKEVIKAESGK